MFMNLTDPDIFVDIHSHNHADNPKVLKLLNLRLNGEEIVLDENKLYSVGIHPWDLKQDEDLRPRFDQMARLVKKKQVCAIGETGYDRSYKLSLLEQKLSFETHLELSKKVKKPLILHVVRSHSDVLESLKKERWGETKIPLIHHDYRGGMETTKHYSAYSCYFSYGSSLWKAGEHLDVFRSLPLTKIFLETDDQCQYSLEDIYAKAAELKGISVETLKISLRDNFLNLLSIKA